MAQKQLVECEYQNIGKKEVLEAYELWLADTLIDVDFENAWLSLMQGKVNDPEFKELELIFIKANALQMEENMGEGLSDGQHVMLNNYYCCFPIGRHKLLTIVKQFFTRFHIYYQNIGFDDKELTSLQKIHLASNWEIEKKLAEQSQISKEDVVVAYNNWLGNIPFEGSVDWAWAQLENMTRSFKDYRLGFVPLDLGRIQRRADFLFQKNDFNKLSNDDKAFIISYWICFQENADGLSIAHAKHFFDIFAKYCKIEGLNPYKSSLDQIKTARIWRDEVNREKEMKQERKRRKCI